MAPHVAEGFLDRREDVGRSIEIPFFIFEAADEAEVKTACDAAPESGGLPKTIGNYRIEYYSIDERINETTWKVVARYSVPVNNWNPIEPPEGREAFDTGGGTQHITQSLATIGMYGPKATNKLQGAIGFTGKEVQGVDIVVPVYNWPETHWLSAEAVTRQYRLALFNLTGKVNNAAFRGFAAGEVLFMGASGDRQGDDTNDPWQLTFKFAALPNRSNFQVGDITVASKKGWEYLWVQYADDADDEKQQVIKKPVAVYIEKVYEEASFVALGIGVN